MFKRSKPSDSDLQRRIQLDNFVKLNPSARPLNADSTTYEVPISTIYGRLSLYVHFPSTFPTTPPLIQVTSLVQHPYVDADMYLIHHPKIQHWSPVASAGQVVSELVVEWTKNPPAPAPAQEGKDKDKDGDWVVVRRNSTSSPMSVSPSASSSPSNLSPLPKPTPPPPSNFSLSLPIPTSFPFLSSLTLTELQHLDSNPQLLTDHLLTLPSSIQLSHIQGDMVGTLMQQVAQSLAMQGRYEGLRERVMKVREEVEEERRGVEERMRRQGEVMGKWSVGGLVRELERGLEEAERKSEKMRERYMGGRDEEEKVEVRSGVGGEVEDDEKDAAGVKRGDVHSRFIDSYVKQRALVHERSAKRERLMELIQTKGSQHWSGYPPHG